MPNMRSSSSRNLAHHAATEQPRPQIVGLERQVRADSIIDDEKEKFIGMQVLQSFLLTIRIFFLLYDVIHCLVYKAVLYARIGRFFGSDPDNAGVVYPTSMGLITLLLLTMIVFTVLYMYLLVHEKTLGITLMGVFLAFNLLYEFITFGQYYVLESAIVCTFGTIETIGIVRLIYWIQYKHQVRYEELCKKREAEVARLRNSHGPPSITISFTGSESLEASGGEVDSAAEEENVGDVGEHQSFDEHIDRSIKSYKKSSKHEEQQDELESSEVKPRRHHQRHHHDHQSDSQRQPAIDESESDSPKSKHDHRQGHRSRPTRRHRSKDHLTVPDAFNEEDDEEDEDDTTQKEESEGIEDIVSSPENKVRQQSNQQGEQAAPSKHRKPRRHQHKHRSHSEEDEAEEMVEKLNHDIPGSDEPRQEDIKTPKYPAAHQHRSQGQLDDQQPPSQRLRTLQKERVAQQLSQTALDTEEQHTQSDDNNYDRRPERSQLSHSQPLPQPQQQYEQRSWSHTLPYHDPMSRAASCSIYVNPNPYPPAAHHRSHHPQAYDYYQQQAQQHQVGGHHSSHYTVQY